MKEVIKTVAKLVVVLSLFFACTNVSAFSTYVRDDVTGALRLNFVSESFGLFKTDKENVYKGRVTMKVKDLEGKLNKNNPEIEVYYLWDKNTTGKFYLTTGKVDGQKVQGAKWGPIKMDSSTFEVDKSVTYYIFYRMWLNNTETETGDRLNTVTLMQLFHLIKDGTIPSIDN